MTSFNDFNLIAYVTASRLKKEILQHSIFWLIYLMLNTLRWGSFFDDYLYSFKSNLVEFSIHIILVYFNLYFLLPRLIPKRYLIYIFTLLAAVLFMTFIRIIVTYALVSTDVFKEADRPGASIFDINYVISAFIGQIYVIGFTAAIKITIDYVKNLNRTKELENKNIENELSMLKSQLQPHFFFNTLNNLYALILEKSNQASETVIKLSEFMSYVIYDGNKKRVPLIEEINYIQNYIELEKLRFGERVNVELSLSGSVENYRTPPLLLLPFIENAFKHGVDCEQEEVFIYIDILVKDSRLIFRTKNKKIDVSKNSVENKKKGIGLKNTKRRLGLLFEGSYELTIIEDTTNYTITLKIPLE